MTDPLGRTMPDTLRTIAECAERTDARSERTEAAVHRIEAHVKRATFEFNVVAYLALLMSASAMAVSCLR